MLHIYTANHQPAIKYIDNTFEQPYEYTNKPNCLIYARCCAKKRPAKNLVVQCYYADTLHWCADGKGCKSEKLILAKKRKEFKNRSLGQKARLANVRVKGLALASPA